MRKKVYEFCNKEMKENPLLYLDKFTKELNTTLLSESFLDEFNISSKDEDEVFELVYDWQEQSIYREEF